MPPLSKKQKLELTWIGKDQRPNLEPRILVEDSALSYHAPYTSQKYRFDNRLIVGDNLLAVKALEHELTGAIKCVMIDPPYNTGSAFEYFDDGIEHSLWLTMMRDRVDLLRRLLSDQGSLWITIDDNEAHYLKVVCDEVFGRTNFVANVIWQKKYAPANDAKWLSDDHDHILVYAKDKDAWRPNKLPRTAEQDSLYSNPDDDARGPWMSDNYTCAKTADERPNLYYSIVNPNTGEEAWPKRTRVWAFDPVTHAQHVRDDMIYWGQHGTNRTPRLKKFRSQLRSDGRVSSTIWTYDQAGHNQDARREVLALNPDRPFSTPKPEKLIGRIVALASNPGDLVLDSFAGSGTTGAVAHKMGRRWIMIEMGEHAHTHIIPRLKKVIDGDDPGGITEDVGWKGGGGFRYYRLAPSLIATDAWGNPVINTEYNAAMLAEALCKLEGFIYAPSETVYWQQGRSTERDFLYVTTANLGPDQLRQLSDDVGPDRSLLVLCTAFRGHTADYPNLTVRKIPTHVLDRCEWGKDDYSLAVANLPAPPPPPGQQNLFTEEPA